jgi:hypothetical protein
MVVKLDSKTQSEVNRVCDSGVETYISKKHKENIMKNLERGFLGSFIGSSLLFLLSKFNNNIKLSYLIVPASFGIISSSLVSLSNYNSSDEEYRQDFEEVCKNSSQEN